MGIIEEKGPRQPREGGRPGQNLNAGGRVQGGRALKQTFDHGEVVQIVELVDLTLTAVSQVHRRLRVGAMLRADNAACEPGVLFIHVCLLRKLSRIEPRGIQMAGRRPVQQ